MPGKGTVLRVTQVFQVCPNTAWFSPQPCACNLLHFLLKSWRPKLKRQHLLQGHQSNSCCFCLYCIGRWCSAVEYRVSQDVGKHQLRRQCHGCGGHAEWPIRPSWLWEWDHSSHCPPGRWGQSRDGSQGGLWDFHAALWKWGTSTFIPACTSRKYCIIFHAIASKCLCSFQVDSANWQVLQLGDWMCVLPFLMGGPWVLVGELQACIPFKPRTRFQSPTGSCLVLQRISDCWQTDHGCVQVSGVKWTASENGSHRLIDPTVWWSYSCILYVLHSNSKDIDLNRACAKKLSKKYFELISSLLVACSWGSRCGWRGAGHRAGGPFPEWAASAPGRTRWKWCHGLGHQVSSILDVKGPGIGACLPILVMHTVLDPTCKSCVLAPKYCC